MDTTRPVNRLADKFMAGLAQITVLFRLATIFTAGGQPSVSAA